MAATDRLLRAGMDAAKPVLNRFGILAAPARDALAARRVITIERPSEQVHQLLGDENVAATAFGAGTTAEGSPLTWRLRDRGQATARVRPTGEGTELVVEVHLRPLAEGRPRYADNAGVIATRAAHRVKSLIETGEIPRLTNNPAGRDRPDPYGEEAN